jgi:hypothetical protein
MNSTGRRASDTRRVPRLTAWRHASTTNAPHASRSDTSSSRSRRSPRCRFAAPRLAPRWPAPALLRPAARECRRASRCVARGPAPASAAAIRSERMASSAAHSAATAVSAGGRRWASSAMSVAASEAAASSSRPSSSHCRVAVRRACSALARSPCAVSVSAAVSRARGGPDRSRKASATSALAATQRAWARGSPWPKPRAARRSNSRARARSPSCAMAMPRSASAGASLRSATCLSAPRASPAASARADALISESMSAGYTTALWQRGDRANSSVHVPCNRT